MRFGLLLALLVLAACAPPSGDELVDKVMLRVDPFGECLEVGQTLIYEEANGPDAPPGSSYDWMDNEDMRIAARAAALPWSDFETEQDLQLVGDDQENGCATRIGRPVFSDEFAFVDYSASSGAVGIYVFEKEWWGGWAVADHVHLGFW